MTRIQFVPRLLLIYVVMFLIWLARPPIALGGTGQDEIQFSLFGGPTISRLGREVGTLSSGGFNLGYIFQKEHFFIGPVIEFSEMRSMPGGIYHQRLPDYQQESHGLGLRLGRRFDRFVVYADLMWAVHVRVWSHESGASSSIKDHSVSPFGKVGAQYDFWVSQGWRVGAIAALAAHPSYVNGEDQFQQQYGLTFSLRIPQYKVIIDAGDAHHHAYHHSFATTARHRNSCHVDWDAYWTLELGRVLGQVAVELGPKLGMALSDLSLNLLKQLK